ncbi:CD82 antigen isoform X2 [Erinaceus europaeus]|uniref:Tetraspanin n=1 Tax=Erinaceus europaeus TaxID=9365 RepID=A0ABM3W7H4_ERIEU|nr:CD82 antigen isoform X2 [Erinaceus europaeus]
MGSACIKVTKYFLFLFNLLFFILGAVILGFGLWILVDKSSFISVLQASSRTLNVGAYVFISVGSVTLLMGFLGCFGAVNEVRCLLGLLKQEMGDIVGEVIRNYKAPPESSLQKAWDYVQHQAKCCGWENFSNWTSNVELMNYTSPTIPCSCNKSSDDSRPVMGGFCEVSSNGTQSGNNPMDWPVYTEGCMEKVQAWLQENLGAILGVCVGIAIVELLGMILSICLCRHVHSEDYSKVPKY